MRLRFVAWAFLVSLAASAQESDRRLASLLAVEDTRRAGVAEVVASKARLEPRLIQWTRDPPKGVNRYELEIGLADCFAEMRTEAAVPFLIRHIRMERWPLTGGLLSGTLQGMETDERMADVPAARALVRIGMPAVTALMKAYSEPMTVADRMALLSVVAKIGGSGAKEFLRRAVETAEYERKVAAEALQYVTSGSR